MSVDPRVHGISLVPRTTSTFLLGTFGWAWVLWGSWVMAMPSGGLRISAAFLTCALLGGLAPSRGAIAAEAENWQGLFSSATNAPAGWTPGIGLWTSRRNEF